MAAFTVAIALPIAGGAASAETAVNGAITYQDGAFTTYIAEPDGSNPQVLFDDSTEPPTWSPDGARYAYVTNNMERLVSRNVDGSDEITLIDGGFMHGAAPEWTADGQYVLFTDYLDQSIHFVLATSGEDGVFVPRDKGRRDSDATTAPDGTVVFNRSGEPGNDLWRFEPGSGAEPTPLIRDAGFADFSSDGSKLAYVSTGDDGQIWIADADGGNRTQLTDLDGYLYSPAWSPDGTRILFRHSDVDDAGVKRVDVKSGQVTMVVPGIGGPVSWRPR